MYTITYDDGETHDDDLRKKADWRYLDALPSAEKTPPAPPRGDAAAVTGKRQTRPTSLGGRPSKRQDAVTASDVATLAPASSEHSVKAAAGKWPRHEGEGGGEEYDKRVRPKQCSTPGCSFEYEHSGLHQAELLDDSVRSRAAVARYGATPK